MQAPLLAALTAAGIGATGSYPTALADVPALRPLLANPDADVAGRPARGGADRHAADAPVRVGGGPRAASWTSCAAYSGGDPTTQSTRAAG